MRDTRRPAPEHAAPRARASGDRHIFLRHWLRDPLGIGAAQPSGDKVARAMAREIALERPGAVRELGGGTGGVTRGLVTAGCPVERIVIIEREPEFADYLEQRFHGVRVICGDVCDADALLRRAGIDHLSTVISSLPVKWFPRPAKCALLDACFARLGSGAFVQLTNALTSPLPAAELGLSGEEVARIWAHFLPTQVWRYRRRDGGQRETWR